ncbi:DEAD/DEAH box helicase [Leuconostoc mesenteroides]|jgi:competence protein ComFA|uniref:DEAD/DEAH box helicase n=1 Tax=Leuconostoc mesenteroides TaxID=1245 RepID=UPI000E03203B|nr:helicase-related protein [Leuconostoc mesenteroides]STY38390.1 Transcription-repair-coupling factor [Leuconostoc mesenteroides]
MNDEYFYGRQIIQPKVETTTKHIIEPFIGKKCQRCGQKNTEELPNQHYYCNACLILGRVSSLDNLVSLPEPNQFSGTAKMTWQGELTQQQEKVSNELLVTLFQKGEHLVWAVTGAGKTEMLFPVIHKALCQRLRVAIVSPRVDVIVELAPRIQSAFEETELMILHGNQKENYRYTQLVLATTHQMLRFYHAFDLVIVDEVDSFPFAGDAMLAYAVNKARKENSALIYLTATPTLAMRKKAGKKLPTSYLSLRFHQHVLPEIKVRLVSNWRKRLPNVIKKQIIQLITSKQRFLIFVPKVSDLKPLHQKLHQLFPSVQSDYVHAADPFRQEKVKKMRDEKLQYLITTTILERGVTFPRIDVLIIGADDKTFSENALVQIAGRVGRSADRPTGLVQAYVQHINLKVRAAQKQIIMMNRRGEKLKRRMDN